MYVFGIDSWYIQLTERLNRDIYIYATKLSCGNTTKNYRLVTRVVSSDQSEHSSLRPLLTNFDFVLCLLYFLVYTRKSS